jgi:hypothetical protein
MDPNANLDEIRRIVARVTWGADSVDHIHDLERLAELVGSLDHWIVGGGFLPKAWAKGRSS